VTGSAAAAGTGGKSDCLVRYEPGSGPLRVGIRSSVRALFGPAIEAAARAAAAERGVRTGELEIEDDGALDYVIASRVEAALRKAGLAAAPAPRSVPPPGAAASPRRRRRRSRLYLPANQPDLVPNSGLFGADCLILDLEDSVAPDRKVEARILARRSLVEGRGFFGASELAIRINPLSGPFGAADLEELAGAFPQAIILPKAESAADLEALDRELSRLEARSGIEVGSILVMPLVETALGVARAVEIALASPRNAALCFGAEDFARDLGVRRSATGEESLLARQSVVLAARAAGIQAHDSVFSDAEDLAGLAASCQAARRLGFAGTGLAHPRQIEVAHRAFDPDPEELAEAERIVAALEAAEAAGSGVASLGGKMIDAPVAARARELLREARPGMRS